MPAAAGPLKHGLVSTPAVSAAAITPSDTADLPTPTRGIYVGVGGNLTVNMLEDDNVVFVGLLPGVIHPIACSRIFATGTTAASIVGIF
jgi:hypothetical protein